MSTVDSSNIPDYIASSTRKVEECKQLLKDIENHFEKLEETKQTENELNH